MFELMPCGLPNLSWTWVFLATTPMVENLLIFRMPDPDVFGVGNVLELIGPDRIIEVVQVKGQKGKTMKLGQFITYYL